MENVKNPTKFVKVMNIASGVPQIIPLSTWERLSKENPKAIRKTEFMFACDEQGNKVEPEETKKS